MNNSSIPQGGLTRQAKRYRLASVLITTSLIGAACTAPEEDAMPGGHNAVEFRDLNHNGQIDPYEDPRLAHSERVDDLLQRMTLEEKVGTLLHGTLPGVGSPFGASPEGYDFDAIAGAINKQGITSFITRMALSPVVFAEQNNAVQELAAGSRLGIPVTISTDPRNHFQAVLGAGVAATGFSLWPDPLGFAAIGDPALVREFASIAAAEYRAVGIHMALSPQADLATEPRWPRINGTFGSDPVTVSELAGAYVEGFQGGRDGPRTTGVATVVKHWVGYGAQPEGYDAHNHYGRTARLSNESLALHIAAFDDALAMRPAGIMPTYAILEGVSFRGGPLESVGAGFSNQILQGMLREEAGFDGIVISDWAITNDCPEQCMAPTEENPQAPMFIGMPWGVEDLSKAERLAKGLNAGIDQFGGVQDAQPLLDAVSGGLVSIERIDMAVRRALLIKVQLGLFEDPFVDPAEAARVVGNPRSIEKAEAAQRRSSVLLKNVDNVLPLRDLDVRIWLYGVDLATASAAGLIVVDDLDNAEVAIVRVKTPSESPHPHHFFGSFQAEGRLDFRDGDEGYEAIRLAMARVPTVVAVDMDRPAVLTDIRDRAAALLVLFGSSDEALLDIVIGNDKPEGRLPFELPASMDAVNAQLPALPDDSHAPAYARGAGISYDRPE